MTAEVKNGAGTAPEAPLLQIDDVSIQFGDFKAISHVSTTVGKNEIRFFIGPNGAGKTTILDAICGKNRVSGGRIIYKGEYEVSKMKEYVISNLGIGRRIPCAIPQYPTPWRAKESGLPAASMRRALE